MFIRSRRDLLRRVLLTGSSALVASALRPMPALAQSNPLMPDAVDRYLYFTRPELAFLNAALDRLIPTDKLGPGAREAGVAFFLDQQMVSPYGRAERWYMQGPWREGTKQQGYQLKLTPAQLYRRAIAAIDAHCKAHYGNKVFAQLTAQQQDDLLHAMADGKLNVPNAPVKEFMDMFWQNTQEGYLADPMYGGNRNFAGWKLIGFPGPRYNYVDEITQYGKRYNRPYISIKGYDGSPATDEYGRPQHGNQT